MGDISIEADGPHDLVVTPGSHDRSRAAELIAQDLARSPAVTAVFVYGSVARGESTQDSDIDLLVVGDAAQLSGRQLRRMVSAKFDRTRPALSFYTLEELKLLLSSRVSFASHLVREGRLLYDRDGTLTKIFASFALKPVAVEAELKYQLRRLRSFEDTSQFNGNFLFCFAQLYVIGKAIAMVVLAASGRPEYNKDRAFAVLAHTNPALRADLERVAELKPFYLQVTRRQEARFPFSYRDAEARVPPVISAIRKMAEAS